LFRRATAYFTNLKPHFGYIFALDAVVYARDGRSLFISRRLVFLAMFPLSGAMWWGFELINEIVQNWHYLRPYDIPEWWAHAVSWVFFSTVVPAVWETADWVAGLRLLRRLPNRRGFRVPRPVLFGLLALGVLFFVLPSLWPTYFFPLIWGFCGFLWEFWNFWAFPRWYYTVPFVGDFLKVFEMPLLGYLGYGPFAWEIFALFWFVAGLVPNVRPRHLTIMERQLVRD
jgi:hypothetical protein